MPIYYNASSVGLSFKVFKNKRGRCRRLSGTGNIGVFCKRPVGNHPIEKVRKNHWSAIK